MLTHLGYYFLRLKSDRKGLETIEYAIMAAIVVAVAFVGYHEIFNAVNNTTSSIANNLTSTASNISN